MNLNSDYQLKLQQRLSSVGMVTYLQLKAQSPQTLQSRACWKRSIGIYPETGRSAC